MMCVMFLFAVRHKSSEKDGSQKGWAPSEAACLALRREDGCNIALEFQARSFIVLFLLIEKKIFF